MADTPSINETPGLALYLAEHNYIDRASALEAYKQAEQHQVSYVDYLVKQHILDSSLVAKAVSGYCGLPCFDIKAFALELIPQEFLGLPIVKKRVALPLFTKNGMIYLAVADPMIENINDIGFLTGLEPRLFIADSEELNEVLDKLLSTIILSEFSETDQRGDKSKNNKKNKSESSHAESYDAESAPVINYVNKIITDAVEKSASDIHFERYDYEYRIRYRIHGVLYPIASPPINIANFLLTRIKIMSNLDITEHRIPQDGRFKLTITKFKTVDFRVSVCPTLYGEKIVLRLLDPSKVLHAVDELGMEGYQRDALLDALSHTQGFILVTGPTGSGKTVTLYSALNYLNSTEDNIMSVEDPIEIPLHGINQVNVYSKVGLTFSSALRSFLRQDPDIIMVGEIRDLETAQISVQAAQTGHLVLSTLHTNSGPETITRLMYMGVEPFNIASSLILVVAQRLLRLLCDYCKKPHDIPSDILLKEGFSESEIATLKLYEAGSCDRCFSGYQGRSGIFEVMPISDEMRVLIMRGATAIELQNQATQEGLKSLREAGLDKVREGKTSLSELNRAFK